MDQSITRRKVVSEVMAQARAPALEVVNGSALCEGSSEKRKAGA